MRGDLNSKEGLKGCYLLFLVRWIESNVYAVKAVEHANGKRS